MKTLINCLLIIFLLAPSLGNSQIMIAKPGDTVMQKSAMLEVKSNDRGFLPPRMSNIERKAIPNPASGLMVFDTTKQAMYVYTKTGWKRLSMDVDSLILSGGSIVSIPNLQNGDLAGHAVKVFGEYAIIGAYGTDVNGKVNQGVIYFYNHTEGGWILKQRIAASDGLAGDQFGISIAATDSFVFVGANADDIGENSDQGSVYVYKIVGDSLTYYQKISGQSATSGDQFGSNIEADDYTLIIGAQYDDIGANSNQGSVYFFEFENGFWQEKLKYYSTTGGNANDFFGYGISIDSNYAVVGCSHGGGTVGDYGVNQNKVFVFKRTNGVWSLDGTINNPTGLNGQAFGQTTTVTNNVITIGASMTNGTMGNTKRGAVHVFTRNGNTWDLLQTLAPIDSNLSDVYGDYLGISMSRSGNFLLIGAHFEDTKSNQVDFGASYLYEWNGAQFKQRDMLKSLQPATTELFGGSVSIDNEKILIGAFGNTNSRGAVYFFYLQ